MIDDVGRRLDRLERENRRLKRAGVAALAVMATVFLMGQARPPTIVEAQQFIVRNADGARVAWLATDRNGLPSLTLFDKEGQGRINLSLSESAAAFVSLTGSVPRASDVSAPPPPASTVYLAVYGDGTPRINWGDSNGKLRARMGLLSRGLSSVDQTPYIYFFDEDENITWAAP